MLMLALVATLMVGALAVAMLAGTTAAHTKAQVAADLAALGAATAAMYATAAPCEAAHATAQQNGAEVVSCVDEGAGVFIVVVRVKAPAGRHADAPARAGPASAAR